MWIHCLRSLQRFCGKQLSLETVVVGKTKPAVHTSSPGTRTTGAFRGLSFSGWSASPCTTERSAGRSGSAVTLRTFFSDARNRLFVLAGFLFLWVIVISGRLVMLQLVQYGDWMQRAQRQQQRTFEV